MPIKSGAGDAFPLDAAGFWGRRPVWSVRGCWLKTWLTCAAFFYPALWFAGLCVMALPSLLQAALPGGRLVFLRVNAWGVIARSAPVRAHIETYGASFFPATSLWIIVPLVAVVAIALALAGRTNRVVSGLFIALLADVALVPPWMSFRELHAAGALSLPAEVLFFALLCFGLRWMLRGWAGANFWRRVLNLYAGFVLLIISFWAAGHALHRFYFWPPLLALSLPPAVAAFLVSVPKLHAPLPNFDSRAWRPPAFGLLLSVLLVTGITWAGPALTHAFDRRQQEANEAAVASLPPIPVNAPYPKIFFQKGVSFSAEFPNPYASAGARQMLRSLQEDGVNAVALVPYGWIQLGSPEVHSLGKKSWESDEGLSELSRLAHALGMKVMLKPGIWVQGGGSFAGDIKICSVQDRAKWFAGYGAFIERYAKLATAIHADIFCVGGEFAHLTPYAAPWRAMIARVRAVYPGPLTYAANFGEEFEKLSFWDALDYIGLQDYYPLPDDLSTEVLVRKVAAVQARFHKPVIFTEVGFPSVEGGNRHPWDDGGPGEINLKVQARCYEATFRAFYNQPWFKGMYWWKVGSNGFGGPQDSSLTPWGKPAMAVVQKWYENGGR